ncbi:MAG: hypothetical protein WCP28_08365 [Actinomycetes bacterium]
MGAFLIGEAADSDPVGPSLETPASHRATRQWLGQTLVWAPVATGARDYGEAR